MPKMDFCRNLRTKRGFISDEPPANFLTTNASSTGYWCLRTMGPFGPDDLFVCGVDCGAHRSCYRSSMSSPV